MKLTNKHCYACSAGYHDECAYFLASVEVECCCPDDSIFPATEDSSRDEETGYKRDAEVRDPKSTGRKRAAVLYPIKEDQACEWQGLKFAGGGAYPIVGCISGIAKHRHHGPNKDTLVNESGNVHRICNYCHNRWHTLNDPVYSDLFDTSDWKEHDSSAKATPAEQLANETRWSKNRIKNKEED